VGDLQNQCQQQEEKHQALKKMPSMFSIGENKLQFWAFEEISILNSFGY
jgi:hypothetical protein